MKNIFKKGLAAILTAGMLAGCSSDYLDVPPVTSVSSSLVQTTQEGAQAALYGLCQAMYTQYTSLADYLFVNGEPWIQMVYGDVFGQDYYSYFFASATGPNFNWVSMNMKEGWMAAIGWRYAYNLINQANMILDGIDTIEGDRDRLDFIKAQALTIRAHAYVRLLQLYGPRWQNSQNGEKYVCVMRLHAGTEELPLVTMNDVLNQLYSDLTTAEGLFESCGVKRDHKWEPDASVAYGIHARAAMLKEDWATAQTTANKARQGYPIMTAEEYKAGFAEANGEWIWNNAPQLEGIYYFAHGSLFACNGPYPAVWGNGAGAINYELYKQIPSGDIRAELFFTPDKLVGNSVTSAQFWNDKTCDPVSMNLNSLNALMMNQLEAFGEKRQPNESWPKPYTNFQSKSSKDVVIAFGAQYKFWCTEDYGTNSFPFMRGAEMLLNEAEAAYHNDDTGTALACLAELNAQRNPNYTCNKSGEALLNEIKLQRRIELWGEGYNFFDLKRWNEPLVRNVWEARNTRSNNIPQASKLSKDPSDNNGWRWSVPQSESQYNSKIDRTLVD